MPSIITEDELTDIQVGTEDAVAELEYFLKTLTTKPIHSNYDSLPTNAKNFLRIKIELNGTSTGLIEQVLYDHQRGGLGVFGSRREDYLLIVKRREEMDRFLAQMDAYRTLFPKVQDRIQSTGIMINGALNVLEEHIEKLEEQLRQ